MLSAPAGENLSDTFTKSRSEADADTNLNRVLLLSSEMFSSGVTQAGPVESRSQRDAGCAGALSVFPHIAPRAAP